MNKAELKEAKKRVSKEFDETLRSMIRLLPRENEYSRTNMSSLRMPEDTLSECSTIIENELRRSLYRSKSATKYENLQPSNKIVPRLSLRPIQKSDEFPKSNQMFSKIEEIYFHKKKVNDSIGEPQDDNPVIVLPDASSMMVIPEEDREIQKNTPKIGFDVSRINKQQSSKILRRLFPNLDSFNMPFKRTSMTSMQFHLPINIEHTDRTIIIVATEFHTIERIKAKIFKREGIEIEKQALFCNEFRLEGSNILYNYRINSKSQIKMRLCELLNIYGKFDSTTICLSFYSSVTIKKMKDNFSARLDIGPEEIVLKFKTIVLNEDKELFSYHITDGCEIEIVKSNPNQSYNVESNHPVVIGFYKMTDNLSECRCQTLRYDAIANILKLTTADNNSSEEIKMTIEQYQKLLQQFDKTRRYHHIYCFKLRDSRTSSISQSLDSSTSEVITTSNSGSDSSLKSAILAENKRIERKVMLEEEYQFTKELSECKQFKAFKHLLKYKIGSKCNLTSVALLYKYCSETVRYVGFDGEENNPKVEKIKKFTKMFFEKYFMTDIVNKGGMDVLALSMSDID